jgi:MFS family permease
MQRPTRWYDYITTNIYFFGLTTLSQTNGLVFPLLIQGFLGEAQQGAYLGKLRLWTLMVALLMQALWGILSDRSMLRLGRRRPFIFSGTHLDIVFIIGIIFLVTAEGMTGYIGLFILAVLLQISSNMAHAAVQGLIPDLVPENKRGLFSGVKAILEIPLPIIFTALVIAKFVSNENIPGGYGIAILVLLITMGLTLLVPEKQLKESPPPLDWQPFLRLLGMTVLFTIIILGAGKVTEWIGLVVKDLESAWQVMAWMGLFGLAGMLAAVGVGVWLGIRISLGQEALRNQDFTWWVVSRLAFLVGFVNLSTFAVYYFQQRLGFEGTSAADPAAQLTQAVGIMIFLSALPSGWLADRFGYKKVLIGSGLLATTGILIVLLTTNLTIIYVGGAIIGISAGLFYSANWALGTNLAPKGQAARYLGLSNLAGAGAGAVGAYIGGPIADFVTAQVPSIPGAGYMLLFAIYAGMFIFSIIALLRIQWSRSIKPAEG